MAEGRQLWPEGLIAYKRTPEFTHESVPAGLLRAHATKAGVWAKIHLLAGQLVFHDLVDGTEHLLEAGVNPLICPEAGH